MPFRTIIGSDVAVWKRNPWAGDKGINKFMAKSQFIWSHVPAWTGTPARRPAGVKAINDIFAYVRKKLPYRVDDAVMMLGKVMDNVDAYTTKDALDSAITNQIRLRSPRPPGISREERIKEKAEAHARVPQYERLAALLK